MSSINKRSLKIKFKITLNISAIFFVSVILIIITIYLLLYSYIKNENIKKIDTAIANIKNNILYNIESNPDFDFDSFFKSMFIDDGIFIILDHENKIVHNIRKKNNSEYNKISITKEFISSQPLQNIINYKFNDIKYNTTDNDTKIFNLAFNNSNFLVFYVENLYDFELLYIHSRLDIFYNLHRIIFIIFALAIILFSISLIIFLALLSRYTYSIKNMNYALEKLTQGFFNIEIISNSKDEIGMMFKNLKRMINAHVDILSNAQRSTDNIKGYQKNIDKVLDNLELKLDQQGKAIQNCMQKYETLNDSLNKVLDDIKNLQKITDETLFTANSSTSMINDMYEEINKMAETSDHINYIIELINVISEKTRLIAINSAIEASRSGEAGKSFGVVADEIRELAKLANNAASDIGELFKENEKRIQSGADKTKDVIDSLASINQNINDIDENLKKIKIETQNESNNSIMIKNLNVSIFNDINENMSSINDLVKMKNLLNDGVNKIATIINVFTLTNDKKEIIKDFKKLSKEEKHNLKKNKEYQNEVKKTKIKEMKIEKRLNKARKKGKLKLDSVQEITLYKPKKAFFKSKK